LPFSSSPTHELGDDHKLAFDLAGTVALPSPFPAAGRVLVVRQPGSKTAKGAGHRPRFFIKIVQVVSEKQVVTGFVSPHDVRAVRVLKHGAPLAEPQSWSYISGEEARTEIDAAIEELRKEEYGTGGSFEVVVYEQAVVYVPETAPMLVRVEYSVPAGVAVATAHLAKQHCPPQPKCPPALEPAGCPDW
jgi:hypothetical protein